MWRLPLALLLLFLAGLLELLLRVMGRLLLWPVVVVGAFVETVLESWEFWRYRRRRG